MATWRARWTCPATKAFKYRDFTKKAQAEAFRDLPRADPVAVSIQRFQERDT